jgi:hypothetical protein
MIGVNMIEKLLTKQYKTDTALNARASENYLAISSKVSRFFGPRYIGDDFF